MPSERATTSNQQGRQLRLLGAAAGMGYPDHGCALAPDQLRLASKALWLNSGGSAAWAGVVRERHGAGSPSLAAIGAFNRRLARRVRQLAQGDGLTVVIGGDHAIAPGTWAGVRQAIDGPLGLIWIDTHLDAHTPQTTPTGNVHGMPLAALLGKGPRVLTSPLGAAPIVAPEQVVVVGMHSCEAEELALLAELGVRIFDRAAIARDGLPAVMAEAVRIATQGTAGFGVSLDLDVLDPAVAPGVNTPVAGGLAAAELLAALGVLRSDLRLKAVEIVEYNPLRDRDLRTQRVLLDALAALAPEAAEAHPLRLETRYGAHNYDPQPVLLTRGKGVFVWDATGRRYFDMMGAYSALAFGHGHPLLLAALNRQARRLSLTSRAFHTDTLGPFLARACELTGMERALPMNSGAEGVETALKTARHWAYRVKGVPTNQAEIIVCDGNFHGRTIAIVGFSSTPQYRDDFGPFPAGFVRVAYGDAGALEAAITPNTAAFLVEPIQGEAGIVVPPAGYLARCADICRRHNVLLIADEVQTGLGRTGAMLACDHDNVRPDGLILGKALGGGLLPVSLFLARKEVLDVLAPGDHGSTFGGNPLASAVGLAALNLLVDADLPAHAAAMGAHFSAGLRQISSPCVREVRGSGLLIGVEVHRERIAARELALRLQEEGILTRDVHDSVLRFAPPLTITRPQLDRALAAIRRAFSSCPG